MSKNLPLLSVDEERVLLRKAKHGCLRSRNKLIEYNLRHVISIANRYNSVSLTKEDLINEGVLGLAYAIDNFDPSRAGKLSTYATQWIRRNISRAIDSYNRTIRLPEYISTKMRLVQRTINDYHAKHGIEPDIETLAILVDMTVEEVMVLQQTPKDTVSFDEPVTQKHGGEHLILSDFLDENGENDPCSIVLQKLLLNEALDLLTTEEKVLLQDKLAGNTVKLPDNIIKKLADYARYSLVSML